MAEDENKQIEETVEEHARAEMAQEAGAGQGENWEETARRIEARIKGEMANLMGLQPNATWSEVGQSVEGRTKQAFGGWAGATATDDWETVGHKIEGRIRERAATWSGVEAEQARETDWGHIGQRVDSRMRTGLGSWAGAEPGADWRGVAEAFRCKIDAELSERFARRGEQVAAAPEGAAPAEAAGGKTHWEEIRVVGSELLATFQRLLHEGNIRRIIIKQGDRTIAEFPLTVGVVGAIIAPTLAAVGAIAALVTECTIVIEKSA